MPFVAGFTLASEVIITGWRSMLRARMNQLAVYKLTLG